MKKHKTYIKTLDRLKVSNLAGRLIRGIERVIPPDTALFYEAVLGVPTVNRTLSYLPFNRQVHTDEDVTTTIIGNRFHNPMQPLGNKCNNITGEMEGQASFNSARVR